MVRSKIESDISYPDFKEIDIIDNGLDASAYDINVKNIDILIALGKLRNDYKSKGIFFVPIYLVINDTIDDKIGVYEFLSSDYTNLLDEDGDLDISLIKGPLLFNFVTNTYLKSKYKNYPIEPDSDDDEDDDEENNNENDIPETTKNNENNE